MDNRSDEKLVACSRSGDKSAYAQLVKKYYRHVFLVCMGMLGRTSDAEDVSQEVMLKGFVAIKKLRDGSKFAQWITRIAKNECQNISRKEKNYKNALKERAKQVYETPANNHALEKAIEQLPPDFRQPLIMYYFDGQNVKQVAEKMNMSTPNVYLKLRAATNQLHQILIRQGELK